MPLSLHYCVQSDVSREFISNDTYCSSVFISSGCSNKCHRLEHLNNRHSFLADQEALKPKIKVLPASVLDERPFPGQ